MIVNKVFGTLILALLLILSSVAYGAFSKNMSSSGNVFSTKDYFGKLYGILGNGSNSFSSYDFSTSVWTSIGLGVNATASSSALGQPGYIYFLQGGNQVFRRYSIQSI